VQGAKEYNNSKAVTEFITGKLVRDWWKYAAE